mmetsp:Transcript_141752/g.395221  ORF Transcript_141752/g.395221 Transcript_141752/m.395221 type:complete len:209 (-) Transcript_141752:279-905(-)
MRQEEHSRQAAPQQAGPTRTCARCGRVRVALPPHLQDATPMERRPPSAKPEATASAVQSPPALQGVQRRDRRTCSARAVAARGAGRPQPEAAAASSAKTPPAAPASRPGYRSTRCGCSNLLPAVRPRCNPACPRRSPGKSTAAPWKRGQSNCNSNGRCSRIQRQSRRPGISPRASQGRQLAPRVRCAGSRCASLQVPLCMADRARQPL